MHLYSYTSLRLDKIFKSATNAPKSLGFSVCLMSVKAQSMRSCSTLLRNNQHSRALLRARVSLVV